jgi:acetyltransferase-like isoleucine patch superfamily enzyme
MLLQRVVRRLSLCQTPLGLLRKVRIVVLGGGVGRSTRIPRGTRCTWPHQLKFGNDCRLQEGVFFNYDSYWKPGPSIVIGDRVFIGRGCEFNISRSVAIGDDCLIASGVKIIDHDHGVARAELIAAQPCVESPVVIGRDVWIGVNAVILKGVVIGDGAVIGASSVVTKPIPAGEIWCGVPARKIGER